MFVCVCDGVCVCVMVCVCVPTLMLVSACTIANVLPLSFASHARRSSARCSSMLWQQPSPRRCRPGRSAALARSPSPPSRRSRCAALLRGGTTRAHPVFTARHVRCGELLGRRRGPQRAPGARHTHQLRRSRLVRRPGRDMSARAHTSTRLPCEDRAQ